MFNKMLSIVIALAALAFMCANAVEAQVVTEGLISYWTLDEADIEGDTVKDVWGNNDGTIVGGPEVVPGKINEALLFDGEASLVEIPDSESLDITEAITIEFWFLLKGNSTDNFAPRLVSKGQSTLSDGSYGVWVIDTTPGHNPVQVGFRSPGIEGAVSNSSFFSNDFPDYNDDAWHHVAATYDGERGKIYLDGEAYVDVPASGKLAETDDPLHLGDGNNQRHFNGALDEVRIYKPGLG